MFKTLRETAKIGLVTIGYPEAAEELEVLKRTTGELEPRVERVLTADQVVRLQDLVRRAPSI